MVVLELALTLVLLVGAGPDDPQLPEALHARHRDQDREPAVDAAAAAEHEVSAAAGRRRPGHTARGPCRAAGPDPRIVFYDRLLPKLEAVAGVESVVADDERAAVRQRPPRHRDRRAVRRGSRRRRRRKSARSPSARSSSTRSASSCGAAARFTTPTARPATRPTSSTRSSPRSSSRTRIRSAAGSASRQASRDRATPSARSRLAHYRRHQPDHPALEPAGRGAARGDVYPAPPGPAVLCDDPRAGAVSPPARS